MTSLNKNRMKPIIESVIGLMLVSTVVIAYAPAPQYLSELTCISNSLIGILLLISAARSFMQKKPLPNLFYSCATVTLLLVFFVCMGSLTGFYHMNFKGAFFFLHVLNPLAVLAYYLLFVNETATPRKLGVLFTPCAVLLYLLFDFIIGKMVGSFRYGFFEVDQLSLVGALIIGVVTYLLVLLIGFLFTQLNALIHKKQKVYQSV